MIRSRIALAAVIVAALLPAAGILTQVATDAAVLRRRDDPISVFERRLAPLREALRGEPLVGYLPPPGVDREALLYTLRYTLAPVQVRSDLDAPLVVADGVRDPSQLPPQLRVRRDFGGGLLLLEAVR
jgi:hypothetical protein